MAATRTRARTVVIRFLDALLRDTVAVWVDSLAGYQVTGAVSGRAALVELCREHPPDVAVVQLGSAAADELTMISALRGVRPNPHVVGLHPALDPASLLRLHRAGANRLVSSRAGLSGLRAALAETQARRPGPSRPAGLSERELEVLTLLSAGCPVTEIADTLEISPHTVTNHKRHIFTKLNVHSRAQAAAEADRLGLDRPARGTGTERVVVVGGAQDSRAAVADLLDRGASAVLGAADAADLLPAASALVTAGYL
ncbi:response regulator transcription factor, partial [Actinophytocola sp.]|uniref:response regulator transcription factor n=1 Tax=Actinophytocola sp. TaxID=1872138 RepID=UPI002D7E2E90